MILQPPPEAIRLLADPDHKPVRELLVQWIGSSLDDTLSQMLFPGEELSAGQRAVLDAEARILMGLRKVFAGASRAAAAKATPPSGTQGNSPGGFV